VVVAAIGDDPVRPLASAGFGIQAVWLQRSIPREV
jgi:hypothetical protein